MVTGSNGKKMSGVAGVVGHRLSFAEQPNLVQNLQVPPMMSLLTKGHQETSTTLQVPDSVRESQTVLPIPQ